MGVKIADLLPRQEVDLQSLAGKRLAIDTSLFLYQFLTSIRMPDGRPFTNKEGKVTSHLIGLFSRTTKLLSMGIKLCFVLDGKHPELKKKEIERRAAIKAEAARHYAEAAKEEDLADMKKFASRTVHLTKEMIQEAKEVIELLGIPVIQAPGEAEAQASFMAMQGSAWAVASQDADALLFGTPRLLRNLAITGRKKKTGTLGTIAVQPEIFVLQDILKHLKINQDQFIALGMLVGTDFNVGGIKGIGPKKALALAQQHTSLEQLFKAAEWEKHFDTSWQEIHSIFSNPDIEKEYEVEDKQLQADKLKQLLIEGYGFGAERVEKTIRDLQQSLNKRAQQGLATFL